MRKLVLAWLSCGLLSFAMPGTAAAQEAPWANKFFGNVLTKDFGIVAKGAQLKYSFKVTNIYKVPMEITNIRVTCGCLTVTPKTMVLEPNESRNLDINMDGRRFSGPKSINIFVTFGPQFVSTATLTVTANTRQDVVLNPGEIDFGVAQRGSSPSQFIDVEYAGALDWRLTEIVKNGNAPFELRVEEVMRQSAQVRRVTYRIHATLKPDAAAGNFKEEILLKTNDPASPSLTFAISGNVQAALTAAPALVSLNSLRVGEIQEKKVVIRGSRPFRITNIDGQGQGISAQAPSDRTASTHIVTVRCRMDQPSELRKSLLVHTNLDNETVVVTVEAKAVP